MQKADLSEFHPMSNRLAGARAVYRQYFHLLEPDDTAESWLEKVRRENLNDAIKIDAVIRGLQEENALSDRDDWQRMERHQEIRSESDSPLFPGVDYWLRENADQSFENFYFRPESPQVEVAWNVTRQWAFGGLPEPILTLAGIPGTGKTHLAIAAGKLIVDSNSDCIYRSEADLLGEIQSRFATNNAEGLIQAVCQVSHLILDDMGVTAMTDWGKGMMDRIIDARYRLAQDGEGRTLITTNANLIDLNPRIVDRIRHGSFCRTVQIKAESYRRVDAKNG